MNYFYVVYREIKKIILYLHDFRRSISNSINKLAEITKLYFLFFLNIQDLHYQPEKRFSFKILVIVS